MDEARVLDLRRSGKGYNEISAIVGLNKNAVGHICRKNGLGGFVAGSFPVPDEQVSEVVSKAGYDYVGGYTTGKSPIVVRCRDCGRTFERQYHIFRDIVNGTWKKKNECPYCKQEKIDNARKKRLAMKEAEKAEHECEAQEKAQQRAQQRAEQLSRKASEQLAKRLAIHVCKNCGTDFCIKTTNYNSDAYCSKRCQQRWHERIKNEKRMDKLKERPHDTDITLEKLFKRDGGVCYICGCPCDWSDIMEKDGTKIAGDRYPSIDHVKPVSKGGTHTWGNIKLACRACNTQKGWK